MVQRGILLGVLFTLTPIAKGQSFYVATGGSGEGELYVIDGSNGSVTSDVGPLVDTGGNHFAITGLALQAGTGFLYGVTSAASPTDPHWLVQVEPSTAQVTPIGNLSATLGDITFDPTSGTLYGAGTQNANLYTINLLTGATTPVGSAGFSGGTGHGLAADSSGTLFTTPDSVTGSLYTYNKTTGTLSTGPSLGGGSGGSINALTFGAGGTLYGIESFSGGVTTHLVTVNTATGQIIELGAGLNNFDAIAPVPEPSTYGLVFGGGLAGLSLLRRARSR